MTVTYRSTLGVFDLLGNLLRATADNQYSISDCDGCSTSKPLFSVLAVRSTTFKRILVRKSGQSYTIPDYKVDRSREVLALLEQLINLQKSSTDKPSTQAVELIH